MGVGDPLGCKFESKEKLLAWYHARCRRSTPPYAPLFIIEESGSGTASEGGLDVYGGGASEQLDTRPLGWAMWSADWNCVMRACFMTWGDEDPVLPLEL